MFFRGRELQKRLAEREKEELEELKTKIFSEEHDDPSAEFERVCALSYSFCLFFCLYCGVSFKYSIDLVIHAHEGENATDK